MKNGKKGLQSVEIKRPRQLKQSSRFKSPSASTNHKDVAKATEASLLSLNGAAEYSSQYFDDYRSTALTVPEKTTTTTTTKPTKQSAKPCAVWQLTTDHPCCHVHIGLLVRHASAAKWGGGWRWLAETTGPRRGTWRWIIPSNIPSKIPSNILSKTQQHTQQHAAASGHSPASH